MPIAARFYQQFKGFAIAPEDVSFGEAESLDISINRRGQVTSIAIPRRSVTITLRGINITQAQVFIDQAQATPLALVYGSAVLEDITLGGYTVRSAVLVKVTPTLPINVAGQDLMESLELEYHSQRFV